MSPAGFGRALMCALAAGGLVSFSLPGLLVALLAVAWLCLPKNTRSDDLLTAIGEGKIRVFQHDACRAKNRKK